MKSKRPILPVLSVLIAGSLLVNARADITTGLVGYWSLSDGPGSSTVSDSTANGNTGTLVNYTDGTYNNMWSNPGDPHNGWPFALIFNQSSPSLGNNTYVNVPDSTSLNAPTASKAWTLAAWVKPSVAGTSEARYAGIIAKGNQGAEAYALYMNDTAGSGKFSARFNNAGNTGGETRNSVTVAQANTWYHVAVTVQEPLGTNNAEESIWVNGIRENGADPNTYTTVFSSSQPVTIGARANSSGTVNLNFQGLIDDVRIYSRALTTNDIQQLYNNKAFTLVNSGLGTWNGLAGSGGNATLDTTSLNFCTNIYTAPVGTAASLPSLLAVESASNLPPTILYADRYYSSGGQIPVANTNITITLGGVALGTASSPGTNVFLNSTITFTLTSPDGIGLKDGPNPTAFLQSGNGTVVLVGDNSFSGGVTINPAGTIQLGNGSGAITGSELGTAGVVMNNGSLVLNGNNSLNLTKTIVGTGTITWKNPSTLTLNSANTYSGGTIFGNNTIQTASVNDGVSPVGTGSITMTGGATLLYTGTGETTARQVSAPGGVTNTVDVPSGVTLELDGQVLRSGGSGTTQIVKTSAGTLNLGGTADNANLNLNITGGTVILNKASSSSVHALGGGSSYVGSGATLQLSGSGGVEMSTTVALTVNSGGVLDLNAQNNTIASLSLSGAGIGATGALVNSAVSSISALTAPITLTANTTIGGAGAITLPSPIGGLGMSLTYAGSGMLSLSATNNYTGGTTVSSGTLDIVGTGVILGNVTVSGSGILEVDNPTGLYSVATLTLPATPAANSVNLTYAGTQTIAVLMLGSTPQPAGVYGASATNPNGAFIGSGTLTVTGQADWDPGLSNVSPGSGGNGTWNAANGNWWTGSDTTWPNDALALFAGTAGTVTLASSLNADGLTFAMAGYTINNTDGTSVLTLDGATPAISIPAGSTTISCNMAESGTGGPVAVTGPGTLTLTGTNSYAGGTIINGAVVVANSIADANCSIGPSGTVTFFGGGTLSYTGTSPATTTRNMSASGASFVNVIDVPAGNLEVDGQVTCAASATFRKTGVGTLTLGGTGDNSSLGIAINQGLVVVTKTSTANVHGLGGNTSSVGTGANGNTAGLQLGGSGGFDLFNTCILTVNSPDGFFDVAGQSDKFSTLTLSGTGPIGTGALINSAAATTSILTNGGNGVVLAAATTIGGPGNIALASVVGGTGTLTYGGTGTLTFYASSANTYSGGTLINSGGTVTFIGNANAAGTGTITDNGTLNVGIVGNNAIFPNAISGPGIVNIVETSANNLQQGGSMAGFTGTLNCPASASAAKFQILTTGVSISSAATINIAAGGTFFIANAGVVIPCPVNIYGLGNSETYGALRIETGALVSGPVNLLGDTTIGGGGTGTGTISGVISDGGLHYAVTKTVNPGTIQLSGVNTYSGVTTINGGTLLIGGAGQLGSGNYGTNLTVNATFNYASSAAQTLSGVVGGTNLLVQSGFGALTLTATNTFTGSVVISNGASLTLSGGGCLGVTGAATNFPGSIANNGVFNDASSSAQTLSGAISGTGALVQSGSGTLTLATGNSYTGGTVITNGATLTLALSGSINTTPSITLGAGATLDVSAYTSYSMLSGITLNASGTGTVPGSTAAAIKGSASSGATVTVAGPMALTFKPQTFTGDTTHPSLFVSQISSGQLVLSGSSITVNNAGGSPLGAGTYSLIQVAAGGTITLGSPTVTVTGSGLAAGATATVSVSGTSVNLVVTGGAAVPDFSTVRVSGGNLIFSGVNGTPNGTFYVLTSTNVALPLSQWTTNATSSFSPTGTFSVTNAIGANPKQFFRLKSY